jgi:hypothetical protein
VADISVVGSVSRLLASDDAKSETWVMKPRAASFGGDLYVWHLLPSEGAASAAGPRQVVESWQCRNVCKSAPVSWKSIAEQASDVDELFASQDAIKQIVVVFLALNLGAEVNDCISGQEYIAWSGNACPDSLANHLKGRRVPKKMVIVVLSSTGAEAFMGKAEWDSLTNLKDKQLHPRLLVPLFSLSPSKSSAGPAAASLPATPAKGDSKVLDSLPVATF